MEKGEELEVGKGLGLEMGKMGGLRVGKRRLKGEKRGIRLEGLRVGKGV